MSRLVAIVVTLVAACSHSTPPASTAPASNVSAEPIYGGAAFLAAASDPLAFLPADSELVISIDMDKLRKSFVWPIAERFLRSESGAGYDGFVRECGFDPALAIRRFTISIRDMTETTANSVSVVTGLSRTKLLGCMEHAAFMRAWTYVTKDGITTATHATPKSSFALTFLDETTSVWSLGAHHATPAALRDVLAAGVPLRKSAAFLAVHRTLDASAPAWIAVNGTGSIGAAAKKEGIDAKNASGSIRLDDGIGIKGRVAFSSVDSAAKFVGLAKLGSTSVASNFARLDITADGSDLVLDALISQTQVQTLTKSYGNSIFDPNAP